MFYKVISVVVLCFFSAFGRCHSARMRVNSGWERLSVTAGCEDAMSRRPQMNIIMATDENYLERTRFAMETVVRACSVPPSFVVFVSEEIEESSCAFFDAVRNLRREVEIRPIRMQAVTKVMEAKFRNALNAINGNKFLALKLLLPDIGKRKSGVDAEVKTLFENMHHFLWLDSDLIVLEDLCPLYEECLAISYERQQPFVSSNLAFFHRSPDTPGYEYFYKGGIGFLKAPFGGNDSTAGISGGVLFGNLDVFTELEDSFPCWARLGTRKGEEESLMQFCIRIKIELSDEGVLNAFLNLRACDTFFLSPVYNCRPDYINVSERYLNNEEHTIAERRILQDIVNRMIAVLHWDSADPKPSLDEVREAYNELRAVRARRDQTRLCNLDSLHRISASRSAQRN